MAAFEPLGAGPVAALQQLFGETGQVRQRLLDARRDVIAGAAAAHHQALADQLVDGLARGHPRDVELLGQQAFGRQGLVDLVAAGAHVVDEFARHLHVEGRIVVVVGLELAAGVGHGVPSIGAVRAAPWQYASMPSKHIKKLCGAHFNSLAGPEMCLYPANEPIERACESVNDDDEKANCAGHGAAGRDPSAAARGCHARWRRRHPLASRCRHRPRAGRHRRGSRLRTGQPVGAGDPRRPASATRRSSACARIDGQPTAGRCATPCSASPRSPR